MQGYGSLLSIFLKIFFKNYSKIRLKASNISEDFQKLLHLDILCTNNAVVGLNIHLKFNKVK